MKKVEVDILEYSNILLRIGLSIVFLWFGISQVLNPSDWVIYMPSWLSFDQVSSSSVIFFNGVLKIIFGGFLLIGFFTRTSAAILVLNLLVVLFSIGYNEIAVRDFGLFIATICILLNGPDKYCIHNKFRKK